MVTREQLKTEIDKVQSQYLDILYKIIQAFTGSLELESSLRISEMTDWQEFIAKTYGCLAEAPIQRGEQGPYQHSQT